MSVLLVIGLLPQPVAATGETEEVDTTTDDIEVPDSVENDINKLIKKGHIQTEPSDRIERFCLFGIGWCSRASTDTGYQDCDGHLLSELGVSWNANGSYDSVHLIPSNAARLTVLSLIGGVQSFASATTSVAWNMYWDMHDCLGLHGYSLTVRSWTAIWQQLHCHLVYNMLGGGGSWDLEGHRASNWFGYLNPADECSW